jgi:hypothetical protein
VLNRQREPLGSNSTQGLSLGWRARGLDQVPPPPPLMAIRMYFTPLRDLILDKNPQVNAGVAANATHRSVDLQVADLDPLGP